MRRWDDIDSRPGGQFLGGLTLTVTLWVVCACITLLYLPPCPPCGFSREEACVHVSWVSIWVSHTSSLCFMVWAVMWCVCVCGGGRLGEHD